MEEPIREGAFYLNDTFAPSLKMVVEQREDGFYMQNRSEKHGRGPVVRVENADWAALSAEPSGKVW